MYTITVTKTPETIKELIDDSGKSMENIATYIGISRTTLYRKLTNEGEFTITELNTLLEYLDYQLIIEIKNK